MERKAECGFKFNWLLHFATPKCGFQFYKILLWYCVVWQWPKKKKSWLLRGCLDLLGYATVFRNNFGMK
jgi:hypothetical protein